MSKKEFKSLIEKNQGDYNKTKKPHHPSKHSGVTFGPGIDMRDKSSKQIRQKYKDCLTQDELNMFQKARGLSGQQADDFIKNNKFELSKESYKKLLQRQIQYSQKQVARIMKKDDVCKKYKQFEYDEQTFGKIPQLYKDILVDMFYNGRFRPETRQRLIPLFCELVKKQSQGLDTKNIQKQLNKKILKIYNNPEIGNLRCDKNRGKNIENYIQNANVHQNSNNQQFKNKREEVLNYIDKNQNNLGGVDLGFDVLKTKFFGMHFNNSFWSLKNSFDKNDLNLFDLVVPLKIFYDTSIKNKNISVSLDPLDPTKPDGQLYKKIYYPLELEGTPIGNAMIQADYLMKQLNLGRDENNKQFKYPLSLRNVGLDINKILEKYPKSQTSQDRARLWIVVLDADIRYSNNSVQVRQIKMGVKVKRQQIGQNGMLKDVETQPSKINTQFVKLFTQNYHILQKEYPVFSQIKKFAKSCILARILYQNRCQINYQLINNQYNKLKTKVSKTKNRLQYRKQDKIYNGISIRIISGGCDLNYNKSIKINKNNIQTDDSQNQYEFVDLTKNYTYFVFQKINKCKYCNEICNNDAYSLQNRQCYEHSSIKCQICRKIILKQGININKFKYHKKCLMCSGCQNSISQKQVQPGKLVPQGPYLYHKQCYNVGYCCLCNQGIKYNEKVFNVNEESAHIKCFQNSRQNPQIENNYQKCAKCMKPLTNDGYSTDGTNKWHAECVPTCQICHKSGNLAIISGNKKVHPGCLKCCVCNKNFDTKSKFGSTNNGKYCHAQCFTKL